MYKKASVLLIISVLLAITVYPASAITFNYVKDFEHPFVGLAVFYDANGEFSHRCSGSLLSPTVFLTAGHCVEGVASARVYFQQDAGAHYDPATQLDPVSGYPDYCAAGTEAVCTTGHQLVNFDPKCYQGPSDGPTVPERQPDGGTRLLLGPALG